MRIYTIGHSDHPIEAFIALLQQHGITLLADVRSQPYSRWTPQFNREELAPALQAAGIAYQSMGDSLGGRPADRALYEPGEERPNYERLAETSIYQTGLARLLEMADSAQVAVMCSEGDFHHCHRHLLITQTLLARGVEVRHIQPDGATVAGEIIPKQLGLF